MVALGTFEWTSLKIFKKVPRTNVMVMITVTSITAIFNNLALDVMIGIVISAVSICMGKWKKNKCKSYLMKIK